MIQESKYLGGDMEHTHLVKGLDYALLEKVCVFMVNFNCVLFEFDLSIIPINIIDTFVQIVCREKCVHMVKIVNVMIILCCVLERCELKLPTLNNKKRN